TSPRSSERTATYTIAAASTTATATAAPATAAMRSRRLISGLAQDVPHAAHGVDERTPARLLDLAAQVPHVDAQRVGGRSEVVAPGVEAVDAVGHGVARREHQHRHPVV